MPVLLLPPRYTSDSTALWSAAISEGWHVERLLNWRVPDRLVGHEAVLYGEHLFADVVADALSLALIEAPFGWLAGLPERYLLRKVDFTTLGEARERPGPAFMKPADDKCFPARVYSSGAELPWDSSVLPDDTPVLISEPVQWTVEYRCFVLDRKVETYSPYAREGGTAEVSDGSWPTEPSERDHALKFAQQLLTDPTVEVPPAFVMDVGEIRGRGWAVIEANPAWGAGIYGCDPKAVLRVISRACLSAFQVQPEDNQWVKRTPTLEQ